MSASPWPPYLFLAPAVEYAAPRVLGVRDWFRLKLLLSPSGGLDPGEARFWLTCREPRSKDWHQTMDSTDSYLWAHWHDLLELGRPLPFHIERWTIREGERHRLFWRGGADRLERDFQAFSFGPRLEWK